MPGEPQNWWYEIASGILGLVGECMDPCDYSTYVSTGKPTADCDAIAAWIDFSSRPIAQRVQKCAIYRRERFVVTITRCCSAVDSQIELDPAAEDRDAECFLRDLDALYRCLACGLPEFLQGYRIDCRDENPVTDIVADQVREGDCYSADIFIEFERKVACDCPAPE